MRPLSAHCHFGLGAHYRRAEQPEAEAHLRSALAMYRDMDMRFWVAKAAAAAAPKSEPGSVPGQSTIRCEDSTRTVPLARPAGNGRFPRTS
jgi:hypothetical protein